MMFRLIKQVLIALLSFSGYLTEKYRYLNNKPGMIRPTFINIKHIELKYFPFIISLDKCNGSCNAADD